MKYLLIVLFPIFFCSCQMDNVNSIGPRVEPCITDPKCDESAIIDKALFDDLEPSGYEIDQVVISGDCLEIEISAAGCNGEDWELYLLDSGRIAESNPVQRYLKLILENPEDCEALITKTVSFDISCLKSQGNSTLLNLANWKEQIRYRY